MENELKNNALVALNSINQLAEITVTKELLTSDDFVDSYTNLISVSKYLEDLKKNLDNNIKEILKAQYFETGDSSIESNGYKYTYIPETVRESFDSKTLKSADPELYKQYVKISNVSDSMRVTKKDK